MPIFSVSELECSLAIGRGRDDGYELVDLVKIVVRRLVHRHHSLLVASLT